MKLALDEAAGDLLAVRTEPDAASSEPKRAGAQLEKTRVLDIQREGRGWVVHTRAGKLDADYCVVATGARNPLREVGTQWTSGDTMVALGYYVPSEQEHIDIQFFPKFEGYIWVFPRNGHLSVGICGKGEPAPVPAASASSGTWRRRIFRLQAPPLQPRAAFAAEASWRSNRVSGDGWIAVGDAAGLVDPITGEGLYYAIRSGDLATRSPDPRDSRQSYRACLAGTTSRKTWNSASRLAKRLFLGQFPFGTVPARMVQFMRRSATFREILQDLFAGTQNYLDLKARL